MDDLKFEPSPLQIQRQIIEVLPSDVKAQLQTALLRELQFSLERAVVAFEQRTGLIVDHFEFTREVRFCGQPLPLINLSAIPVELYKESEACDKARQRNLAKVFKTSTDRMKGTTELGPASR